MFSIVVTAQCSVQSFCPPAHLPSPRASSLSPTVHHCRPLNLENCHLETSCAERGFLSPINFLLQGILLGFSRYIMYDLCTMYRQSFIYFSKRKPFLDKGMMVGWLVLVKAMPLQKKKRKKKIQTCLLAFSKRIQSFFSRYLRVLRLR